MRSKNVSIAGIQTILLSHGLDYDAWGCFYERFVDLEPVLKSSQRAGLVQRQMIDFPLNELRMG